MVDVGLLRLEVGVAVEHKKLDPLWKKRYSQFYGILSGTSFRITMNVGAIA